MSRTIRFIGDIHGQFSPYLLSIADDVDTVQIGDFGIGFGSTDHLAVDAMIEEFGSKGHKHRFIRGNHDDPSQAALSKHYIPDGTFEDGILYLGGAASIDKQWRTPGVDWWPDEELSIPRLEEIIENYRDIKPEVIISHECPEFFAKEVMIPLVRGIEHFSSTTRWALDVMHGIHPPQVHVFGHWHKNLEYVYSGTGTRFICLGIHSSVELHL